MNLQEEADKAKKIARYNEEPVFYCKRCLSLRIMNIPKVEDSDFCDTCNGTDIGQATIEEWEKMYEEKYHHKYLEEY